AVLPWYPSDNINGTHRLMGSNSRATRSRGKAVNGGGGGDAPHSYLESEACHIGSADAARIPDGRIRRAAGYAPPQRFGRWLVALHRGEYAGDEAVAAAEGIDRLHGRGQELPFFTLPGGEKGSGARRKENDGHSGGSQLAHGLPGRFMAVERPVQ